MKETMEQTRDRVYKQNFFKKDVVPPIEEAIELAKEQGISLERGKVERKEDITDKVLGKPISKVVEYLNTLPQHAVMDFFEEDYDYEFNHDEGFYIKYTSEENDFEYGKRLGILLSTTIRKKINAEKKKLTDREKRKVKIKKMEEQLAQLKQEDAEDNE